MGGAASYFYLRTQQQQALRTAGEGGVAGLAQHPAFKHGEGEGRAAGLTAEHRSGEGSLTRLGPGRLAFVSESFVLGCCALHLAAILVHPRPAGMPVGDRLRVFTHYAASFDTRLRNPRWVLEHLSADTLAGREGNRKHSDFVEDAGGGRVRWVYVCMGGSEVRGWQSRRQGRELERRASGHMPCTSPQSHASPGVQRGCCVA